MPAQFSQNPPNPLTFMLQIARRSSWRIISAHAAGFDEGRACGEMSMQVRAAFDAVDTRFDVAKGASRTGKDLLLEGTRGTVYIDWQTDVVMCNGNKRSSCVTDPFSGYVSMLREFAAVCQNGITERHLLTSCNEALEGIRFLKAAYEVSNLPDALRSVSVR